MAHRQFQSVSLKKSKKLQLEKRGHHKTGIPVYGYVAEKHTHRATQTPPIASIHLIVFGAKLKGLTKK